MKREYWNLDNRPHTKLKLEIYKKYLDSWCSIFLNQQYYEEIYIIDCFAGAGQYLESGELTDGSPLITIKAAEKFQNKFFDKEVKNKNKFKIKCIFIENDKRCYEALKKLLEPYRGKVEYELISEDFNKVIESIVKKIGYKQALFFVDPFGIKPIKKESIQFITNKPGGKDILFNYINEGVVRIAGIAKKCMNKKTDDITIKELKTIKNLTDFIGEECLEQIDKKYIEILGYYVENVIKANNKNVSDKNKLEAIAFNMPYPNKRDTIYYLLFISRNKNAIKIVSQVYAKSKEVNLKGQRSLFGAKEQLKLHDDFKI